MFRVIPPRAVPPLPARRIYALRALCLALILGLAGLWSGSSFEARADGAAAASGGSDFLQTLEDIPLMPGLSERAEDGVVFETVAGRIIEATARAAPRTKLTPGRVSAFYRSSLGALGWHPLGDGRFSREGEILVITSRRDRDGLEVRFSLRPN